MQSHSPLGGQAKPRQQVLAVSARMWSVIAMVVNIEKGLNNYLYLVVLCHEWAPLSVFRFLWLESEERKWQFPLIDLFGRG